MRSRTLVCRSTALLIGAMTFLALAGCERAPQHGCSDQPVTPDCDSTLGYDRCMDEGGCWVRYYGGDGCNCPTTDGGGPCTAGSDCEGACVGDDGGDFPDGCASVTEGVCSDHRPVVGCYCYLDDDGVPWDICVD